MHHITLSAGSRGAIGAVVATALLATLLVVTGSPAAAHSKKSPHPSCPGVELNEYHSTLYYAQTTLEVSEFVYYSSANGGTNCLWVQKENQRGTPTSMDVDLQLCSSGNPYTCLPVQVDDDPGSWSYYAGPVTVTQSAGKCIRYRVQYYEYSTPWYGPMHCG